MNRPRINILVEGFADEANLADHRIARYRPNIVLVRVDDAIIIIDPGSVERQGDIVKALAKHGVSVHDITHVIHTHHHLDHTRNSGMFPNVPVIDAWATWNGVIYTTNPPELPQDIRIEKTPGHTYDSLTVFVNIEEGIVAICGDLMWWEGDTQSDIYADDITVLKKNREKVLAYADFVIPGHGPKFAVKK